MHVHTRPQYVLRPFFHATCLLILWGASSLSGCGQTSALRSDRTILPASVLETSNDEYTLVATADEGKPGTWQFEAKPRPSTSTSPTRFTWDFGDGETIEGPNATHTFPGPGSYVVTLTAYDSRDQVLFVLALEIRIPTFNHAPVPDGGGDLTVHEHDLVELNGSGTTDADGDELTFQWKQASGIDVDVLDAGLAIAGFVAPAVDGEVRLVFVLTVSDGEYTVEQSVTVDVLDEIDPAELPLTAEAGPDRLVEGGWQVILDGTGSSGPEGAVLSYKWRQTSGRLVGLLDSNWAVARFVAPPGAADPVPLAFELLFSDGELSDVDDVTVTVVPDGQSVPVRCSSAAECDDGLFCNGTEACGSGYCQPGQSPCPGRMCDDSTETCFPEVRFTLDGAVGQRPLTVTATAATLHGEALPEGTYTWSVDGTEVDEGAVMSHVLRSGGAHSLTLALTLLGSSVTVGCRSLETGDWEGKAYVWPVISGKVRDESGHGIPGVTVSASIGGTTAVTDADGSFVVHVPYDWSGSVTAQHAEYTVTPGDLDYSGVRDDLADQQFTAVAQGGGQPPPPPPPPPPTGCASDAECDDGQFCNGVEACSGGSCVAGAAPCAGRQCDETLDACVDCVAHGDCDDGAFCNGFETCQGGTCRAGVNPCAGQECDEGLDACVQCLSDAHCDDGVFCDGVETCVGGVCQDGVDPCPDQFCDESDDACVDCLVDADCGDGLFCNGAEVCLDGACDAGGDPCPILSCDEGLDACVGCSVDAECNDGLFCNGVETCAGGVCQAGTDACPSEQCDEANDACVECLVDLHCDDGVFCNGAETCVGGSCQAGADPCAGRYCDDTADACVDCLANGDCADGSFCNGVETCVNGSCRVGLDPCPGQLCDETGDRCVDCLVNADCGDGAFCTGVERCVGGVCQAGTDPCPDQYCDEFTDACVDCLSDAHCNDAVFCNGAEVCLGGECLSAADPCPGRHCDESDDSCADCLIDAHCNDGAYCTGVETCVDGSCHSSGDPCASEVCDENTDACLPCAQSAVAWQNFAIATPSGAFEAEFDAIPNNAGMDGLIILSHGAADAFPDLAVGVRFNLTGQIDARNGGAYGASTALSYTPGTTYHVRMIVNVLAHTYSVYVTPEGASEVTLATDFAFRTEQSHVTSLDHWGVQADTGTHYVCGFTITDGPNLPPQAAADVYSTPPDTTLNVAPPGVLANDRDPEGEPLMAFLADDVSHGRLALQGSGSFVYMPDAGFTGTDSFTYTAHDGQDSSGAATVTINVGALTWTPPIGIPAPDFGIEETHDMYAGTRFAPGGFDYRDAGNGPYSHYVDNTAGNATDSGNPYGTATQPRRTIPANLPAGSVVEVHGGPYTDTNSVRLTGVGTAAQPIFVRGGHASQRPFYPGTVTVNGSYVIVENLYLDGSGAGFSVTATAGSTNHHIAFRHSEIVNSTSGSAVSTIGYINSADALVHHIVIYHNNIHEMGDWQAPNQWDRHCVGVWKNSRYVWVLDNELHHNQGDGMQVAWWAHGDQQVPPQFVYIGRNHIHHNHENALDFKCPRDVVVSENRIHTIRATADASGQGDAVVVHNDDSTATFAYPDSIWFLYNEIYDAEVGITCNNIHDQGVVPSRTYIVGNVFHDIMAYTSPLRANNIWSPGVALRVLNRAQVTAANNVVYRCDLGLVGGNDQAELHTIGNVVADLTSNYFNTFGSQPYQIIVSSAASAAASQMHHNLLWQGANPVRIGWGGSTYTSIAAFRAATGKGAYSLDTGSPRFVDPQSLDGDASNDFHLSAGSPCLDAGFHFTADPTEGLVRSQNDALAEGRPERAALIQGIIDDLQRHNPPVDDPTVANTGTGAGGINYCDIGASERPVE